MTANLVSARSEGTLHDRFERGRVHAASVAPGPDEVGRTGDGLERSTSVARGRSARNPGHLVPYLTIVKLSDREVDCCPSAASVAVSTSR
jgi:hypothetical protein